ncbi:hypothetical protein C0995_002528, partial [Termitomyces sp. Mi166
LASLASLRALLKLTAVCGFSGYLVSSMGQKVFVRAFDSDQRLAGVAFLYVGVEAVKSVSFIAFQEDPYKLVPLGKDINRVCVTKADFFFADGQLSILTGDEEGIIRIYDYNPHDPESKDGRHLLLRTEFNRSTDGTLASLTPIEEYAFKRLQLLQGQLTRNVQHVAGLNPKAFRIVRNDFVSKPLSKGILDGNLLGHFEALPIARQVEVTKEIGTERTTVLKDCIGVNAPW